MMTGTVQYSSDVLCYGKVFTVRYCTVVNGDALCVVMLNANLFSSIAWGMTRSLINQMFVLDIFLARASRARSFKKTRKKYVQYSRMPKFY